MQISHAEWSAEIEIVKVQILRWLQQQHPQDPLCEAIRTVSVQDAMILGVPNTIWIYMVLGINGDSHDFDPNLEYSDVWECAVASALGEFRKSPA